MADSTIIRVFPRRTKATPTDEMAFVGEPPLFRAEADEVHISVTFTWDIEEAERLARSWGRFYPVVKIGGPALGDRGEEFVPGRYLRPGYTITSRGCPNRCPFCLVPTREGAIREFTPIPEGHTVQDNNILACSDEHLERVFGMLGLQGKGATFSGGWEARRFNKWGYSRQSDVFRRLRIRELWFGYDAPGEWHEVQRALRTALYFLQRRRKVRCYVLAGFRDDNRHDAQARCEQVLAVGALPFMMLYQGPDEYTVYPREWRLLQRKWTRPAAMLARSQ